jgi:Dienelactone hydrolase family
MKLAMAFLLSVSATMVILPVTCMAKIHARNVEYTEGKTVLEGYIAYDDSFKGRRPGILVVHEWTGLGDYVKSRCRQLAGLGYVALARTFTAKA